MKITIVGGNKKLKRKINDVVNDLEISDADIVIGDETKYSIKHGPAIIINNVVMDDACELNYNDLKNIIIQFMET